MNCTIPFTKDVKFKTSIAEILSISLEHEYTVNESEILGNFIISGEYKSHEVSVNRESFDFVLPFSVSLTNPIEAETLDFEIEDFTYDLIDNSTLKVNIEYSVKAKELVREEPTVEEEVEEVLDSESEAIIEEAIEKTEKAQTETREEENTEEKGEEKKEEEEERNIAIPIMEETSDEKIKEKTEDITQEENVIMNAVSEGPSDFVTYHIHIMQENETIEAICSKYNVSSNTLENYNDLKNITFGDKLIIPDIDE